MCLLLGLAWCINALAQSETGSVEPLSTDPLLVHGTYFLLVEGDALRAASHFHKLLVKNPRNWEANYFMAQILHSQIQHGEVPLDKIEQVTQYLRLALQNGLRFDRLHPDFRTQPLPQRPRPQEQKGQGPAPVNSPPALVLYTSTSDAEVQVLSSDPFGYTRAREAAPGQVLRLESGQRYKLASQSNREWKAWALPSAVAALVVGLVAVR